MTEMPVNLDSISTATVIYFFCKFFILSIMLIHKQTFLVLLRVAKTHCYLFMHGSSAFSGKKAGRNSGMFLTFFHYSRSRSYKCFLWTHFEKQIFLQYDCYSVLLTMFWGIFFCGISSKSDLKYFLQLICICKEVIAVRK